MTLSGGPAGTPIAGDSRALLPPVRKPPGIRPLGIVDIAPLQATLAQFTENVWRTHDTAKPNKFDCFHHTRHVVFRFCDFQDPQVFESNAGWKIWGRSLLRVMGQASAPLGLSEPVHPKVMFASLSAGHRIDVHIDGGAAAARTHKIHIPVRTEPAATFIVDGVESHLRKGFAYEVNNTLPHGAFNGGREDRVHFIFEVFDARPLAP